MTDLRYPVGRFAHEGPVAEEDLSRWIDEIAALPAAMRAAVSGLTDEQLDTPYRPGGWTVRQVVHHVGDSHLNALVRFKWTLTEARPTIKPYDQDGWAGLADYRVVPVETSLAFLELLHARWVGLMRALGAEDWAREFVHPESGPTRLDRMAGLYAWHGRHHLAHIKSVAEREGWG